MSVSEAKAWNPTVLYVSNTEKTICPEKLGILNTRTKFKAICTQVELHILESMKNFHIICCFLYKNPYLVYSTVILKGVTYIS